MSAGFSISLNPVHSSSARRMEHVLTMLERHGIVKCSLLLFLLTVFVSILATYVVRPLLNIERPLGGEAYDGYLELGLNMARGHGYVFEAGGHKVFHRPPLYPVLLMPLAALPEFLWRLYVAVLNAALLSLTGVTLLKFVTALFGKRVAWMSWLIFALNPFVIWAAKNALSAILQMFIYLLMVQMSWTILSLIRTQQGISSSFACRYTLILFAGMLCHGTMLPIALLILSLLAIWSIHLRNWKDLLKLSMIVFSLITLLAPWTYRNYLVTGMFIPVAGNAGLAYFAGNAHWGITSAAVSAKESRHEAELRHMNLPTETASKFIHYYGFTNPALEHHATLEMKNHLRNQTRDFCRKFVLNALEYYFPVVYYLFPPKNGGLASEPLRKRLFVHADKDTLPLSLYNFVLVSLSVSGLITLWKRQQRVVMLVLLGSWSAYALSYFPFLTFVGHALYNFGTIPIMAILSTIPLCPKIINTEAKPT
ncbi:MAG: hypothetical protein SFY81_08595 [Verrucomicrobiota bacterium]|nr:hypothetical protein [Verrucomicrobiota bacterium]